MRCAMLLSITVVALLAATAMAAPSLKVTKPPVWPRDDAPTGPCHDPYAEQGQWCEDGVRPYEYYDNTYGDGGSLPGSKAIYGKVTQRTLSETNKITAFTIRATIRNPMSDPNGSWRSGFNSHYPESLTTDQYYVGTLYDTVLTASFAVRGEPNSFMLPDWWESPYTQVTPYIYATNEDQGAWYCWCPDMAYDPNGDYFVPTWNFGDIPRGQYVTRDLTFAVAGEGLPSTDHRYAAIMHSYYGPDPDPNGVSDILLNRSTSLKISDWLDDLTWDEGIAYPYDTSDPVWSNYAYAYLYDPERNSDVSVFHNIPEPASIGLLGLGVLAIIRRRK